MLISMLRTDMLRPVRSGWFHSSGWSEVLFKSSASQWPDEEEQQCDSECCDDQGNQDEIQNVVPAVFLGISLCPGAEHYLSRHAE